MAEWISVNDELPEDGEEVLIWVGKIQVARIYKGITREEREKMENGELPNPSEIGWSLSTGYVSMERSKTYRNCDVFGNNLVPYCWKATSGPMEWFGQNVSHWMPLPEPPRTPKERGADKQKITCLNCKHLVFSDMYGECNKQLRIVKPSDTCEYAEPKERGEEK